MFVDLANQQYKSGAAILEAVTSKIKLHQRPMSVNDALKSARLVRKSLEVPLVFSGTGPLLVGRDDRMVSLVINDPFISRTHAAIIQEKEDYYVQDLNSKNGTFLNDERLSSGQRSPRPLKHGDRIRFNMVEFQFVGPDGDA